MFANTPGFLDVSKKKKKGKKRATNKITAPLPRNLQEPVPLESDNEDGFEEQNNSEGESLMREGRKTKSVFTQVLLSICIIYKFAGFGLYLCFFCQLAEQEKKKRRDLSLEGASESDDPTWNVVPQKTLKNGEAAPVKTALSSGANSAVFDTEDSHDVTDGEKNEMIQKESVRQGSVKPKRRGKKTPTLEHNSEDEVWFFMSDHLGIGWFLCSAGWNDAKIPEILFYCNPKYIWNAQIHLEIYEGQYELSVQFW